jgi:hypothetical protein
MKTFFLCCDPHVDRIFIMKRYSGSRGATVEHHSDSNHIPFLQRGISLKRPLVMGAVVNNETPFSHDEKGVLVARGDR